MSVWERECVTVDYYQSLLNPGDLNEPLQTDENELRYSKNALDSLEHFEATK